MRTLLWLLVAATVGAYICGPVQDPDLWWHIVVGRWIIHHGVVPVVDHWNMFAVGEPWRAYSWLSEILFTFLYDAYDVQGLLAAKLLIAICLSIVFSFSASLISRDWFFGLLLGVVCTTACFNHFVLRPQTFVWIYAALLLVVLDAIRGSGWTLLKGLVLFVLFSFWANTHITTALGLLMVACWLYRPERLPATVLSLAFALAGTFLTPYLGGEWLTFFSKTGHPFAHSVIAEFQPATIMQYSTGFLLFLVALFVVFLYHQQKSLSPLQLFLGASFVFGSLAVVKFIPLAVIVLLGLIAQLWREGSSSGAQTGLGNLGEGIEALGDKLSRWPRDGLAFVVIVLLGINVVRAWQEPLSAAVTPKDAVDFIEEHSLPHPVLNDFGKGGYLMFRWSTPEGEPEHLVPIDGRTNVNPPEIWEAYHAAYTGKVNWRDYFELVKPETVLWRYESPLTAILLERPEQWTLVYCERFLVGAHEGGFVVFTKKENADRLPEEAAVSCPE